MHCEVSGSPHPLASLLSCIANVCQDKIARVSGAEIVPWFQVFCLNFGGQSIESIEFLGFWSPYLGVWGCHNPPRSSLSET